MGTFKILGRKKVLEAHAFDVQKVRYELPDGRKREYDLVDHADAVTLLAIDDQGMIYLVRQYRIGAEDNLLELPAGILDPGEEPAKAARRELREEIGMDAAVLEPVGGFYMTAGYSNEYMNVFVASGLRIAPLKADDDEFLEVERIPYKDVYHMAQTGEIRDGKSITALFLAYSFIEKRFGF